MDFEEERELLLEKYSFEVKGETYTVLPFSLSYLLSKKFEKDRFIVGVPDVKTNFRAFVNAIFLDKKRKEVIEKWLKTYCFLENEAMSLEKIMQKGWDTDDVGLFILRLYGISG